MGRCRWRLDRVAEGWLDEGALGCTGCFGVATLECYWFQFSLCYPNVGAKCLIKNPQLGSEIFAQMLKPVAWLLLPLLQS